MFRINKPILSKNRRIIIVPFLILTIIVGVVAVSYSKINYLFSNRAANQDDSYTGGTTNTSSLVQIVSETTGNNTTSGTVDNKIPDNKKTSTKGSLSSSAGNVVNTSNTQNQTDTSLLNIANGTVNNSSSTSGNTSVAQLTTSNSNLAATANNAIMTAQGNSIYCSSTQIAVCVKNNNTCVPDTSGGHCGTVINNNCSGNCDGNPIGTISCLNLSQSVICGCDTTRKLTYPTWINLSKCASGTQCVVGKGCPAEAGQSPKPIQKTSTPAPATISSPLKPPVSLVSIASNQITNGAPPSSSTSSVSFLASLTSSIINRTNNRLPAEGNDCTDGTIKHGSFFCYNKVCAVCNNGIVQATDPSNCITTTPGIGNNSCYYKASVADLNPYYCSQTNFAYANTKIDPGGRCAFWREGCGQTVVSMLVAEKNHTTCDPVSVATNDFDPDRICTGTDSTDIRNALQKEGIAVTKPYAPLTENNLIEYLSSGWKVILGCGDINGVSHWTLATKTDQNKVIFSDPYFGDGTKLNQQIKVNLSSCWNYYLVKI